MGLLAAVTVVLIVMMSSLKYNENIYDFLPVSGNDQKAITLYQDITGGQRIIAMFSKTDGDTTATDRLAEAVDAFADSIQAGPGRQHVSEVTTQVDFEKLSGITDFIYQNMPLMLTDSDYVRMERIVNSPEQIGEQLANDVQMIMMPATGLFTSSISNDPLGLFAPVMQRLQARQASMPMEIDNGYIYTAGRKYAIAMLTSPYGSMESARNSQLVGYVDSVAQQTMQAMPDVDVSITGSPVIAVGNAEQIKNDSQWAISISVTLILLLLVFAFRRVKNLLLIGVSIVFGWLFAMAFIAVMRSDVSLIVLGIGSIIIGIAVNYPLHFIAHTDHGGTVREVLKEMVSPLLIGNITTVGAFASLMPLDAPALRDLGFFAAFMLVGTILFVLIFLPHLVRQRVKASKERLPFGRISSMSPERHRWLLWVIFILTVVFGYFSLDTSFDTNMHHINYMTDKQQALLSELHASAGVSDTANVYVVSEGSTWDEALQHRQQIAPLLDSLQRAGQANGYSDVTSFVCSADEQQRRIGLWNDFWSRHREAVMSALHEQAPRYGFSMDAFSDFDGIVGATYTPQPFEHFEPVSSVLFTSSFSTSTGSCSVVDVIDASGKDLQQIESLLNKQIGSRGYAFDFVGMNSAIAKSLSDDFNYIGFACGFIVFLFLWLSFGRLELSLLAFLPMAMGWLWILGMMQLFGMQFNIVNVILATFIFGQGDDYTIFITDGLINEYAYRKKILPSYKNSIVISALIMFIGMGSLIVAKHPALHSLAEVTIVGMFTVVLMAWIVPPLIFNWMVMTEGRMRHVPVTIDQLVRTCYSTVVYIFELSYGCVLGFLMQVLPKSERREAWFHRVICKSMRTDINHISGVAHSVRNDHGEDFSRGSVAICNHQSMLDPVYLLALSPRVLVMVGGKVWRNPIVHTMFRLSRFINANQPVEVLKEQIGKAVADGYTVVIFPEGRRNDEHITRFHKGAFVLAEEIGADILPLYIHGTGNVMPKDSGLAARGSVHVEIGKRIPASELHSFGESQQAVAHGFRQMYLKHFQQMKSELEDSHYFHHYVIYKHTYKGYGVEKETRRLLRRYDDFSKWIDGYRPDDNPSGVVSVINAGRGQFSLLFALVHPDVRVCSYTFNADDAALAESCTPKPANLTVVCCKDETEALQQAAGTYLLNLSDMLACTEPS
jgi:1-acyl-sn-glycerol-3-phosphate acyltransferase